MNTDTTPKGPYRHQIFMFMGSAALTFLFIWLLGFVAHDINSIPGPNWTDIEEEYLDQALVAHADELHQEINTLERKTTGLQETQAILQQSTRESQQTMNQLLEIHRLNLQQDIAPSAEEQQAMADSQKMFLENQQLFQNANQEISELSEQRRELLLTLETLQASLGEQRQDAQQFYIEEMRAHSWRLAAIKFLLLIPLFLLSTWVLMRYRKSAYAPITYAAFIAVSWWVGWTMHQHFPREYFKYIAILSAILVVLFLLYRLIRMRAQPQPEWLMRRYREAYIRKECPLCSYAFQGANAKKPTMTEQKSEPYTCPSCGTELFTVCAECDKVRHALLPHCCHCGNYKEGIFLVHSTQ